MRFPVRRLVLYEPPLPVGGPVAGENLAPYVAAVEEGDLDRALEMGLVRFPQLPVADVTALRLSRGWPRMRPMAKSWIRELKAMDGMSPDVEPYRALPCPSMLLIGERSPEHPMLDASRALARVLPGVRVEWLLGQGHGAMRAAPETVARLIREFLCG